MNLKVLERATLGNLLPTQGDFTTLSLIMDVRKRLALTEAEVEQFEYRRVDAGLNAQGQAMFSIKWNIEKDIGAEIEIGEIVTKEIKDVLEKLQKEKKLEEKYLSLYDKFVNKKKDEKPQENTEEPGAEEGEAPQSE